MRMMGKGIFRFIFYLRLHLNKMEGIFFIRIFAVFFRVWWISTTVHSRKYNAWWRYTRTDMWACTGDQVWSEKCKFFFGGGQDSILYRKITIKLHGTDTMANFVNMLFEFGEYSGVGIKTSLGMGYMKIINEGGRKW